ncbi:quinone oxidoreductase [Pedobacter sp. ISL-68]|uniref:quinone oxidoreductase family protein n=1 Tax=unclassified Pedobacter TaxID=2628915 RepID=UPI001BE563C4|nr:MULTISPECIES: quinone oxidoreductase [unclassified Pedobacter]MBT2560189.1 quinone oxidoreductase [Pedobacter sp. ISL-64]MBT2589168.1 quinone oxidoreductase [Pedobacter sp. ISL-68]
MKAIRFHEIGGPEVLQFEEVSTPQAQAGEVLIKVEAAGVNFADITRRRGGYYPEQTDGPYTIGAEVVGTITELGEGVTTFEIGALVIATPPTGGYAQYVAVPTFLVVPVPPGISAVQATTLMAQGLTAALSIKHTAKMQPGESILIEGAAGGVGSFAVQLAKLYGAGKIIAAASSAEKRKIAEDLGADASVDYTDPNWVEQVKEMTDGKGVDVVIEMAGGETTQQALDTMAAFGRMVYLGQSSGEIPLIDPWKLTVPTRSVTGFSIFAYLAFPEMIQSTLVEIIGFVLSGKLDLQIGAVLPLSAAEEAHRLVEGRKSTGKVVLEPWS